ncbi:MAG: hypothetical protein ACFFAE_22030 [Candidatus Hodarchaeota archaeon]
MSKDQKPQNNEGEGNGKLSDRIFIKESLMDFAGHFSTASAILAGFYMAMCAFIIGIKAQEAKAFSFLDEPLLAEIIFLGDLIKNFLTSFNLSELWPTHFEYMIGIFICLFILSLISYTCFLWVGITQMSMYKANIPISEENLIVWQERGMSALLISLVFSFISLPWALLRFITDQALLLAILLLFLVMIALLIGLKGWILVKKIPRKIK